MKKTILTITSLLLVCIIFCSCGAFEVKNISVIATVNGENILLEEYNYYLLASKELILYNAGATVDSKEFWSTTDIDGKNAGVLAKETALEDAIRYTLLAQEAKNLGISSETPEAREQISSSKRLIAQYGINEESSSSISTKFYLTTKLLESKSQSGEFDVSEENIKKVYEEKFRTIKHILFSTTDPADGAEIYTLEQTLSMANSVISAINNGDTDFDTAMNTNTMDPGLASNPNGYTFTNNGTMVKPFEEAAFALEIGEISQPVASDYGHHVLKREALIPYEEFVASDPEAINTISSIIEEEYVTKLETELKSKASIERNDKVYADVKLTK